MKEKYKYIPLTSVLQKLKKTVFFKTQKNLVKYVEKNLSYDKKCIFTIISGGTQFGTQVAPQDTAGLNSVLALLYSFKSPTFFSD